MRWLSKPPVFVFGAGATKACGGPLTAEILPDAFTVPFAKDLERPDLVQQLDDCLIRHFHVPPAVKSRQKEDYPPLPLLLSLLDLAIDQDRPLVFDAQETNPQKDLWSHSRLVDARKAIEYIIFAVLEARLRKVTVNWYAKLFDVVRESQPHYEPLAISLNYDILLDNVLFQIAEKQGEHARPTYGCDIQTEAYLSRHQEYGRLLKLHGSLNWLYCASCRRLEIGMSKSLNSVGTCKVLGELYRKQPLEVHYVGHGSEPCSECSTPLSAVMITPTRAKDYRNPHIQGIWYQAERALRRAEHVCFVGYSLPDDDLEVIDLLRRGLGHLNAECITVVDYAPDDATHSSTARHPVRRRFESVFGRGIEWFPLGFETWVEKAAGSLPCPSSVSTALGQSRIA